MAANINPNDRSEGPCAGALRVKSSCVDVLIRSSVLKMLNGREIAGRASSSKEIVRQEEIFLNNSRRLSGATTGPFESPADILVKIRRRGSSTVCSNRAHTARLG